MFFYTLADLRGREGRPPGPNSFNFMQFLGKFGKIICWRPLEGWRPHLGEILDPPLLQKITLHIHAMSVVVVETKCYLVGIYFGLDSCKNFVKVNEDVSSSVSALMDIAMFITAQFLK